MRSTDVLLSAGSDDPRRTKKQNAKQKLATPAYLLLSLKYLLQSLGPCGQLRASNQKERFSEKTGSNHKLQNDVKYTAPPALFGAPGWVTSQHPEIQRA